MELLQPVERVGDEEVADLPAAVVEDQRAPLGVLAAARILVLVERGAVEPAQREVVLREVRRHPVDDHADAGRVARVDQEAEVVGGAVARGGREVRADLVAPRPGERVLGQWHELDVGEAEPLHVVDQPGRDLAIGERPVPLLHHAGPGAEVDLVDRHRRAAQVQRGPGGHPVAVAPLVRRGRDPRGGAGRQLHGPREGIGLDAQLAVGTDDPELVERAGRDTGDEQLVDARAAEHPHREPAIVPAAEVADDADALRVGRPDRERHAVHPVELPRPRAERLPQPAMRALGDQVDVHIPERRQEPVGILLLPRAPAGKPEPKPVADRHRGARQQHAEHAGRAERLHGDLGAALDQALRPRGVGMQRAHHHALLDRMGAEDPVRIGVASRRELRELGRVHGDRRAGRRPRHRAPAPDGRSASPCTRPRIPSSGMSTQSGRLFSSYRSS